jgi:hypothetical protein
MNNLFLAVGCLGFLYKTTTVTQPSRSFFSLRRLCSFLCAAFPFPPLLQQPNVEYRRHESFSLLLAVFIRQEFFRPCSSFEQ